VQSTHKIAGDDAEGFADYLTSVSSRGDYYLDGDQAGAEGRWHGSASALGGLGLSAERPVEREQLLALMRGVSPRTGQEIRKAGGNGSRVAGVDMTFSAPKSVSALWAVSGPYRRAQIEAAHRRAVAGALARVEREVALLRTRRDGQLEWQQARSVLAAEFVHTASRLTRAQEAQGVPDPQLHSHLVVLAGQRLDGRFAAVDSRELFRSARVNGAWYRAELAANLQELGLQVTGQTGRDRRYFELAGVPASLGERWSTRSAEIEQAFREFRTRYGRDPRAGELSSITLATRGTKTAVAQLDIDAAWRAIGEEHGLDRGAAQALFEDRHLARDQRQAQTELREQLPGDLTERASIVCDRDLQARACELAAGHCRPAEAQQALRQLEREGELVRLAGDAWTTRALRQREQQTVDRVAAQAGERVAPLRRWSLERATEEVEHQIDGRLSPEQQQALQAITGDGATSVLVGQAGTGKGVVLHAAAKAWQREGYRVIGTAIAGATAERLAADAQLERSNTTDSLLASAHAGRLDLDERTVVVMDEAGIADTKRLSALVELTHQANSKLVLVGDHAQLSPIGAGGLFAELQQHAPTAELTKVRRARNEWEREAWQQLRDGEAKQALAAYAEHGRLTIHDDRQQAAEQMVAAWDRARREVGDHQAVMLTDASNAELDRINHLAQQARDRAGELGQQRLPLRDRPYQLAAGDRIIFTASHPQPGDKRVENGTTGTLTRIHENGRIEIATGGPNPRQVHLDTREFQSLKLAYAQHVYKAQGLTCEHALVLAGGWQTDRERAYVALTRARQRTDIHLARTDIGEDDTNTPATDRLAETIAHSNAQHASISRQEPASQRGSSPSAQRRRPDPEAKAEREPPRNQEAPARESAGHDPEPLGRVGRLLREQQERERKAERDTNRGLGFD
jgi:conjugative relaxase-like TrwC/TraI family protein